MTELLDRMSEAYNSNADRSALRDRYLEDFERFRNLLESGDLRAAEKNDDGEWEANKRVKQGILLGFQMGKDEEFDGNYTTFVDKDTLPPRQEVNDSRMVPGGSSVRSGSYVGDIIQMPPSYINVGAYVDDGTMVDSEALVGSAAQVGQDVHLSTGAKLGGVLEPVNQKPVVVEDNVTLGANSGVYEGVLVRKNAVIAPGTEISSSTEIFDTVKDEVYTGEVPRDAVVIPGSVEYGEVDGQKVQKDVALVPKYRDESTNADTALEDALR